MPRGEARGFTLPSVFVMQGSRGRLAAGRVMRLLGLKEPAGA